MHKLAMSLPVAHDIIEVQPLTSNNGYLRTAPSKPCLSKRNLKKIQVSWELPKAMLSYGLLHLELFSSHIQNFVCEVYFYGKGQ